MQTIFSSVRERLPDCCLVEQKCTSDKAFYAFRGLYNRNVKGNLLRFPYNIHRLHKYEAGISRCVTKNDWMDILIGRFIPFGQEKVDEVLADFTHKYPELTNELILDGR